MSAPEVVREIELLRERLGSVRNRQQSIALVPTMGALHAGHAELLRIAREHADVVVASIFVNPLQFDRKEDLDAYPRTLDEDLRVCAANGVDLVFAPTASEFYPSEPLTFVESPVLSRNLCGAFRPGHFRGMATVVLKLFNVVQPHVACFGEKDAQQLAIIRRMVTDFNLAIRIVPVATVREADGLALSSRNKHLSAEERAVAPVLARVLADAHARIAAGETDCAAVRAGATELLQAEESVRVEYFEIVDPDRLTPLEQVTGAALIAGAIWLRRTRLIDNLFWPGTG
ncbi:MAG: pantoate--beta-alanine ligase [Bryobacterales bacterium]|nr:pantoate--beta-alanine ligase [Bryobacterales bacterium]